MNDSTKAVFHSNSWLWGKTCTIVLEGGVGIIELQLDKTSPNTAFLRGLSVLPDSRNKGFGTMLIAKAVEYAEKHGYKFLQLTAEKSNVWLVEWYKKLSFEFWEEEDNIYVLVTTVASAKNSLVCASKQKNV